MIYIHFSISGADDIVRGLEDWEGRLSDLRPVWPYVDRVLEAVVTNQITTEGQHGGDPWPELAPSTQHERQRQGYGPGHPMLRRTGRLLSSLGRIPRRPGDVLSIHEPQRYAKGSKVPYLPYHQSLAARRKIPRRAVFQLTDRDKGEVFRPLRNYVTPRARFDDRALSDILTSQLHQGPVGIR